MENFDSDPWIVEHAPLSPEKLHALGYLTFAWNRSEYWTNLLFAEALGVAEELARVIIHDLGDITIWEKLRQIASTRDLPQEICGLLDYGARLHERNRVNRNQFVHAVGAGAIGQKDLALRRVKGPAMFKFEPIADDLSDLRRVGEEIDALRVFTTNLALYVHDVLQEDQPPTLPEKPPLPALVWTPLPPTPQKRKPPPQSSPG
jgi:hypothetical protein